MLKEFIFRFVGSVRKEFRFSFDPFTVSKIDIFMNKKGKHVVEVTIADRASNYLFGEGPEGERESERFYLSLVEMVNNHVNKHA